MAMSDVYCNRCRPAPVLATAAEQQQERQRQAAGAPARAQDPIIGSSCAVLGCGVHMSTTCGDGTAQVQASFFGVGAPEAVLVGLVALVIFGPQGLAEVSKLKLSAQSHPVLCVMCMLMQAAA